MSSPEENPQATPKDTETTRDVPFGLAGHEAGHILLSNYYQWLSTSGPDKKASLIGETPPSKAEVSSVTAAESLSIFGLQVPVPSRQTSDNIGYFADIVLRVVMSGLILKLAWWWLEVVQTVLFCQSVSDTKLSDGVLIALLTTTTLNVLGLMYFVANYLFPKRTGDSTPTPPKPPAP